MKDTLNKIKEKVKELTALKTEIKNEINNSIREIFEKNEKLESVSLHVSNHEFNDGDATMFYVNYDEFDVKYDGVEYSAYPEDDDGDAERTKEVIEISKQIEAVFSETDTEEIHEFVFGDNYDSIDFERKEILKK